jgi:hypothetical protein
MNTQEYRQLLAEKTSLERLLKQLPESSVIERMGLEARKQGIEETLASQPTPTREFVSLPPQAGQLTILGSLISWVYTGRYLEEGKNEMDCKTKRSKVDREA